MSVIRQQNWLGQQRVDVPHLRAIESSICADFDVLAGNILAGLEPVIVSGFATITTGALGQPASSLQIDVSGSVCMHPLASESGTIFQVPTSREVETLNASNARVQGGFTASSTNYIGFDMIRSADSSTADLVQFLNPQTNLEKPTDVPLGRTLDYVIYISTQDFATTPGVCPLAIVVTDSSNNVTSITDARELFYRLGSGGSSPDAEFVFPWAAGRSEAGDNTDFDAGDKSITSMKQWMDAMMTRVWELGGGSTWYTPTNVFNVEMVRTGAVFVSNGQYFEWDGTNLHWKGLSFLFDNTTAWYNTVANQTADSAGLTDLVDGECIYVDVDRSTNAASLTAVKATLTSLGTPDVPGSRMVIAWCKGTDIFTRNSDFAVGSAFAAATTAALGMVKLAVTSATPAAPVVFNPGTNGELIVAATGGNKDGIVAGGNGNGAGIVATGGATGPGGLFTAGGGNSVGVSGEGRGTGPGGVFSGGGGGNGIGVQAGGTGTADGVVAGVFGTGSALATNETAGNYAPQIKLIDSAGNIRMYHDHIGFASGRVSELREAWRFVTASSTIGAIAETGGMWSRLSATGVITTAATFSVDTNYPATVASILNGNTAGNKQGLYTSVKCVGVGTDIVVVLEFEAVVSTAANSDFYLGFSDLSGASMAADTTYAYFKHSAGGGNWFAKSNGTSGSGNTDTGVAAGAGSMQKFRIELHGTGTPEAGKALFFMNNSLTPVASHTVNWGAINMMALGFEMISTNTANQILEVGEVLCQWNRWGTVTGV